MLDRSEAYCYTHIPELEVDDATDQQVRLWFVEDVFQYQVRSGRIIDVGWYPSADRSGTFKCVVIAEASPEAWDAPLQEFQTRSTAEVRSWITRTLKETI